MLRITQRELRFYSSRDIPREYTGHRKQTLSKKYMFLPATFPVLKRAENPLREVTCGSMPHTRADGTWGKSSSRMIRPVSSERSAAKQSCMVANASSGDTSGILPLAASSMTLRFCPWVL